MSALGDYIHLNYKNYVRYGTAEAQPARLYQSYKDAVKKRYEISGVSDTTIIELKTRIENNTQKQQMEDATTINALQKKRKEAVYNLLVDKIQSWRPGAVLSGNLKIPFYEGNSTSLFNNYEQMKKQYDDILKTIEKLNKEQSVSQDELSELIKKYNTLTGQIFKLKNDNGEGTKSIVGAINEALVNWIYNSIQGNINGYFGELLVAACEDKCTEIAEDSLIEEIKKGVQGESKTRIEINKKSFSVPFGKFTKEDQTKTSYFIGSTQDKIDVTITVNQEKVQASVKAYSGYRPDLQEVNLLYPVTFLNNTFEDFGNHWLNLHAARRKRMSSKNQKNKEEADEILQKEVAFQALAKGNPLKKSRSANVFVYININTGDCIIKNISEILQNYSSSSPQGLGMSPDISSIHFFNEKMNKPEERIASILNELHKNKIKVSINVKQLLTK